MNRAGRPDVDRPFDTAHGHVERIHASLITGDFGCEVFPGFFQARNIAGKGGSLDEEPFQV